MGIGTQARCGLIALASLSAAPAAAQFAGSVSAATDVRIRGISLNGGRTALTLGLAYDHSSGVYVGAAATAGDTRRFGAQFLSRSINLGYAARLSPRFAWEAGVIDTRVESNVFQRFKGGYTEAYVGLNSERFSGRVFYTPRFFQHDVGAVYVDLNGNIRLSQRLRAFGHIGLLVPLGQRNGTVLPRARHDLRLGTALAFGRAEVQLAWVRSGAGTAYLGPRRQDPEALILSATRNF